MCAGVQLLAFAPAGDRIATVGMDPDHTVALYDTTTADIISSAKVPPEPFLWPLLYYSFHLPRGRPSPFYGPSYTPHFVCQGAARALFMAPLILLIS
jgi:hypothetical protein